MTDDELIKAVIHEYEKAHPEWREVRVTQTVPDTFGGMLAVVTATGGDDDEIDEMCFVFRNGKVQIFQSQPMLTRASAGSR